MTKTFPSGSKIVLGDEAHIYAKSEGGPRWNPALTPDEIDNYDNLILLCPYHHREVDQAPVDWPAATLLERKRVHEHRVEETLGQVDPAPLDDNSVKLNLCSSGEELWLQMIGVLSWAFDFGQVASDEADQACARLQDLFHNNWDLFSPQEISGSMRLEGQAELQQVIDQLQASGYVVYAGQSQAPRHGCQDWLECLVSVQPIIDST